MDAELAGFGFCPPALNIFIARHPDLNREVRADRFTNSCINFIQQTDPVFEASAVFVDALVDQRREKFRHQIAVGAVDFETVEARFLNAAGSLSPVLNQLMDFLDRKLSRRRHHQRIHRRRRSDRYRVLRYLHRRLSARMIHLAEDLRIVLVNRIRKLPRAFDLLVLPETWNSEISLSVFLNGIVFSDDQTPAAFRFFFHIADISVCDHPVVRAVVHDHRRYEQTVRNDTASDLIR